MLETNIRTEASILEKKYFKQTSTFRLQEMKFLLT